MNFAELTSLQIWTPLLTDAYFWIGFTLFSTALLGFLYTLRLIKTHLSLKKSFAQPEIEKSQPLKEILSDLSGKGQDLEPLLRRMQKIEEVLNQISRQMNSQEQANREEHLELKEELHGIQEKIQSRGAPAGNGKMELISSKVDKIYQALVEISETEDSR
ncbi:MAG: hypothetical protein HY610_03820 [Elusimicrobia bacterium]|nr:hypothetical protein [Elusimicrobiota bacterium]